ncbi:hypothetical protein BG005_003875 [Podila minutissima]|nr:hypothetical protein BG005_003875 [Podila minutissima]
MTIPTRHEHCSHSGTLRDHEDERSVCSDVLDHTTMDISKKMLIPANSRLRQLSTLQDFIMDLKRAKDSRSIYVANINPRVSINDLEHVFANFGPFNSCIIQHKHHRGLTSAGYAILELSDSATRTRMDTHGDMGADLDWDTAMDTDTTASTDASTDASITEERLDVDAHPLEISRPPLDTTSAYKLQLKSTGCLS